MRPLFFAHMKKKTYPNVFDLLATARKKEEERIALILTVRTENDFLLSDDPLYIPTGQFYITKAGEKKERLIPSDCARAFCGTIATSYPSKKPLYRKFTVVRRSDPATVLRHATEIRRLCGESAAAQFTAAASRILATGPAKKKPLGDCPPEFITLTPMARPAFQESAAETMRRQVRCNKVNAFRSGGNIPATLESIVAIR
jgi:hypothetical protein